jgi:hypothetical protein
MRAAVRKKSCYTLRRCGWSVAGTAALLILPFLGCVVEPQAILPPAAAQPAIQFAAKSAFPTATQEPSFIAPPSDPNEIRYWVSPAELTPDNWHTVGCVYMLKPECRAEQMRTMMAYYEEHEGKPYLFCIIDNWLRVLNRRPVSRNGWLQIPVCEDAWQWGDLNADCRVDYEDIAIYGSVK